ncbi:MAG TPA: VOC family protein [Candidatus Saccharimonadales bacterium]|nr:VOC family protein [Candidatus Saccharimonadales bacterium]
MQKVTTFLWFNKNAEEAMKFYVDVFNGSPAKKQESRIVTADHYPDGPLDGPLAGLEGKVAQGVVELEGQRIYMFDGGPAFTFNEAASLYVDCESQEEVDYFWEKLSAVPEAEACGWLKDTYGLSWQIIPKTLNELMHKGTPEQSGRVMRAMLQMKKLNVADLEQAFNGK